MYLVPHYYRLLARHNGWTRNQLEKEDIESVIAPSVHVHAQTVK